MKTGSLILIISYAFISTAWSQNVSVDPDFGPNGNGYSSLINFGEGFTEMTIRHDKSMVMLGFVTNSNGSFGISIAAQTSNGLPDTSFGNGGLVILNPDNIEDGIPREIIALPDGKLLIGAYIYAGKEDAFLVMRLLEDGSLDSTFGNAGLLKYEYHAGASFMALSFSVDDQGNIYLIGIDDTQQSIHKLMPDGYPDVAFGDEGIAVIPTFHDSNWTEFGSDIVLMADGKIITTAIVLVEDTGIGFVTSRWNRNGSLDTTFGEHGSQFLNTGEERGVFCSIHPQPDGQIVYKDYYSYYQNLKLFRLDQNGMPDLSFGNNGSVFMDTVFGPISNDGLLICPDGSFLMPYSMKVEDVHHNYLGRFHSDFTADTSFGGEGRFELPAEILGLGSLSIVFQEENKIILNVISEDNFSYYYNTLVRLNVDNHVSTSVITSPNLLIYLSPNPSSDRIVVHFKNTEPISANLELIDNQGRILQKLVKHLSVDAGENQYEFDLADDIPPGIVYVKLNTGSTEQIYPLMIIP